MGWTDPHKFQETLVGVDVLRDGSPQFLILNHEQRSWLKLPFTAVPNGYVWACMAIDPRSGRILVPDGYMENEQLVMRMMRGTITENGSLHSVTQVSHLTDKRSLLGETGPNVMLNEPGLRRGVDLGRSLLDGSDAYVPFSLYGQTIFGINNVSNGPFANGVFYSSDSGRTWRLEKVSDRMAIGPGLCKTKGHIYYFAGVIPLWFSRKPAPAQGEKWETPQVITKTFTGVYGRFAVAGEADTVHICWMDRRHNKWRFNLTGPPIENNDIYYRRRRDSDSEWGKEVWLSKGLLYCYVPTIATESNNVVVAWAGIRDAGKQHTYMSPNDIYYVTSKDGGATWTKPLKVTDGAKGGSTAGMPQVALLNGTIHLLYTQGAQGTPTELSPGLTKLGNDPWPIYYTQRPFPK